MMLTKTSSKYEKNWPNAIEISQQKKTNHTNLRHPFPSRDKNCLKNEHKTRSRRVNVTTADLYMYLLLKMCEREKEFYKIIFESP